MMAWSDYFKGRLAYDLFWGLIGVAGVVVAFVALVIGEEVKSRRRKIRR